MVRSDRDFYGEKKIKYQNKLEVVLKALDERLKGQGPHVQEND